MGNQISKVHHYVPQGILRNFCFQSETTWYLCRERFPGEPKDRNIGSIFCRRHFNSYQNDDGTKDDTLERFFGEEFDNFIPLWIKKFETALAAGKAAKLSVDERVRFVQFFYNHMKRSPDFIEPIVEKVTQKTFHPDSIRELEERVRPLTDDERLKFSSKKFQQKLAANSRVVNFSNQSLKILETLNKMSIALARPARTNKQFIVGSNPVVRFEDYPSQRLGEKGVELWTTLTPTIAVGFVNSVNVPVLELHDDHVRKMNWQLAKDSRAIASKSPKLLSSLAKAYW